MPCILIPFFKHKKLVNYQYSYNKNIFKLNSACTDLVHRSIYVDQYIPLQWVKMSNLSANLLYKNVSWFGHYPWKGAKLSEPGPRNGRNIRNKATSLEDKWQRKLWIFSFSYFLFFSHTFISGKWVRIFYQPNRGQLWCLQKHHES